MTAHPPTLRWPIIRELPTLDDVSVHVWASWLARGDDALRELAALLSAEERERAGRFRFERDQRRYVAGRALLRRLLAWYLDEDPASLRFVVGGHGKPALADRGERTIDFNVAHADDLVLFAVTRVGPVGVDVERVHAMPDLDQVAAVSFSARERAELATVQPASRTDAFFRCWTRKEAYIKAIGDGLSHPLDRFDVSLAARAGSHLLALDGDESRARAWSVLDVAPTDGYAGAVAIESPRITLRCAHLP